MARGGSRYIESLKSLFGVTNGDARLQRTEYLGGKRIPLAFQEVVATSSSADNSDTQYALGQQVVKSVTHDVSSICTKSFTEHGFLHVYGVIRAKHQYCQGVDRQWSRKDFLDYYNPVFDSIGETRSITRRSISLELLRMMRCSPIRKLGPITVTIRIRSPDFCGRMSKILCLRSLLPTISLTSLL